MRTILVIVGCLLSLANTTEARTIDVYIRSESDGGKIQYALNEKDVSKEQLDEVVKQAGKMDTELRVRVLADSDVQVGDVARCVDQIRRGGLKNVSLIVVYRNGARTHYKISMVMGRTCQLNLLKGTVVRHSRAQVGS